MNKKGFTLIELLAVIVVLAIIALIATPIIMNIINNIQEGANARSVEGYMRAYEAKYYATYAETGKRPAVDAFSVTTGDYNGAVVDCTGITLNENDNKFYATCVVNNKTYNYKAGKAERA